MVLLHAFGISVAIVYTIWIFSYCSVLFLNWNLEAIRFRNPALLVLNSVGLLLVGNVMVLSAFFIPIPCFLQHDSRMVVPSLVLMPCVLRGIQYLTFIKEKYRRRFRKLKSANYVLCFNLVFFFLHAMIVRSLSFVSGVYENGCFPTKFIFAYGFFELVCFIVVGYKIFLLIPWSYDSFHVGEDLKRCLLVWAVGISSGVVVILVFLVLNKKTLGSYILNLLHFLVAVASFFVVVVCPVHKFVFQADRFYTTNRNRGQRRCETHLGRNAKVAPATPILTANELEDLKKIVRRTISSQLIIVEMILENKEAAKRFHDFSNRRFYSEMTLFLERAYTYKSLWATESNLDSLAEGKSIIEDFIKSTGPNSINISAKMRDVVLLNANHLNRSGQDKLPHDLFDECYEEVCKLFFDNLVTSEDVEEFWMICFEHIDIEAVRNNLIS
mmetsp:Transcript_17193/g.22667  ORF Transcript_17193/g.22667 Transcript_17193/m.22667 type:complete len:441 (+) Transcript_17193:1837-3159(+)